MILSNYVFLSAPHSVRAEAENGQFSSREPDLALKLELWTNVKDAISLYLQIGDVTAS